MAAVIIMPLNWFYLKTTCTTLATFRINQCKIYFKKISSVIHSTNNISKMTGWCWKSVKFWNMYMFCILRLTLQPTTWVVNVSHSPYLAICILLINVTVKWRECQRILSENSGIELTNHLNGDRRIWTQVWGAVHLLIINSVTVQSMSFLLPPLKSKVQL